jgi:crotonobetainyl-CoA:carnitine CoA-transferase CaiB-like acyl-CoA transferase
VLIPQIAAIMASRPREELCATFERLGLPFAPVRAPGELVDDPHLAASGGLVELALPGGGTARIPALPVSLGGLRPGKRSDPPAIGGDTRAVLAGLGLSAGDIDALLVDGVVGQDVTPARERAAATE